MKCLTVRQPFAALIVAGIKTIECRTWDPRIRGPILIHAGKDRLPLDPEFWPLLERVPDHLLNASGLVIGKVRVSACRRLTTSDRAAALFDPKPGSYGWLLEGAEEISFVPLRGQQKLFNVSLPSDSAPGCAI